MSHDRTQKTKTIADDFGQDHQYTVVLHPAGAGFDLLPRIMKVLGPVLGSAAGGVDSSGAGDVMESKINGEAIGKAIGILAENLIAVGSSAFLKEIFEHTTRVNDDGKEQKVAQHFGRIYQGNYGELFAALVWVLTENFGPFLKRHLGAVSSKLPAHLQGAFSS